MSTDRPMRSDARRNQSRIIEAASELFAERGLGVTLNDVAHHAGVGVGTVYRRYRDKAPLIEDVFERRIEQLVELAEKAADDPDPWRGFVTFLEQNLELQSQDRAFRELLLGAPRRYDRVVRMRARIWPIMSGVIERARDSGQLRSDFVLQDGPMLAIMLGTVIDVSRDVRPDLWRRYFDLMIEALRAESVADAPLRVDALTAQELERAVSTWR